MKEESLVAISRVRRAMPRNQDVMLICDELEKFLVTVVTGGEATPKFDRVTYQREYMRKRRAEAKRRKDQTK